MEWVQTLIIIVVGLFLLLLIRTPVAIAFTFLNIIAALYLWGGDAGLIQVTKSIKSSVTSFSLVPIPLFIFMGEIMFQCGLAPRMIETLDKWFGKVPGRLGIMTVSGGTLLSTLTGSSMGSTAILGSTLLPQMRQKGYKHQLTIGPILASGVLAAMIPPSAIGVLLASIGGISIGGFLIAIIIPGLLMAASIGAYVIIRAKLQPELAPVYEVESVSLSEKMKYTIIYILPLGLIIFLVIGLIFLGIATPTESAAMGILGSIILAAFHRKLGMDTLKKSLIGTIKISGRILLIITGSRLFSEILSFSGVTRNLVKVIENVQFAPIYILLILLGVTLILGFFMDGLSILMVTLPIYMPIAATLGFDPLWFGVLILISIEIGFISPPFGLGLFVMKSVTPETSMRQIYTAALPFIAIYLVVIAFIILFPEVATWLPSMMSE
ncbi:TRAP transporter large permease [Alteribacillus iranensis]|uniref:TRAP transporter, DctM subunit n=1 Tax=Alteribacillus iranensis TaxID=930128 RepID=A0A1I2EAA4_9BACI|nr:TRAP transporter large permease subunit [Alteribacillus iranensis]SFE89421.1 TRAP transporter, DctM subunit [Alteribacillus iranensis]